MSCSKRVPESRQYFRKQKMFSHIIPEFNVTFKPVQILMKGTSLEALSGNCRASAKYNAVV